MSLPRHSPPRWVRRAALAIAFSAAVILVFPTSARAGGGADDRTERIGVRAVSTLWTAWLELWAPVADWLDAQTGSRIALPTETGGGEGGGTGGGGGGGTGGSGGLDPGGGGGYADPNG